MTGTETKQTYGASRSSSTMLGGAVSVAEVNSDGDIGFATGLNAETEGRFDEGQAWLHPTMLVSPAGRNHTLSSLFQPHSEPHRIPSGSEMSS